MSRNVLKGNDPHTYIDDLESFYYVICWIVAGYERPGVGKSPIPKGLNLWDLSEAYIFKDGLMVEDPCYAVSPWFGSSLRKLLKNLFGFFRARKPYYDDVVITLDPTKDYDEFLGHIKQAILDLEGEPPFHEERRLQNEENLVESPKSASERDRGSDSDGYESIEAKPRPRRRKRMPQINVRRRPLRSTANYGRNFYR